MDGVTLPPARLPGSIAPDPKVQKAAEELEAVFLGMVVNEMLKSATPTTMNGGHGEEMFQSFLGNEIGAVIAKSGGIGIARSIETSMKSYQK